MSNKSQRRKQAFPCMFTATERHLHILRPISDPPLTLKQQVYEMIFAILLLMEASFVLG